MLVIVMLRHAWDMQPLSVPSHMQSGSSAPAMHLYSKQVRLMQIYSYYRFRFSGWGERAHVTHNVTPKWWQARYKCKLSQQLKLKRCQMICCVHNGNNLTCLTSSISDSASVPPNLTQYLYLRTQYLSRESRVYNKHLTVALSEALSEDRAKQNRAELLMRPESVLR